MTDHPVSPSAPAPRRARADDLAAVERLLDACDLPRAGVAAIFGDRAQDFVVADDPRRPGELAAVAGLELCGESALLRSVAVRPEWRAHRLGELLVRHAIDAAEARGLRALYLLTTTAEHYFPRFGFEPVTRESVPAAIAETAEFRDACPASAVAMARRLTSSG